ncbi:MAG: hypothetical protein K6C41_05345 [Lachnospiraceae bacterium]|nr:hypothetical protein [Lachnospiraceae bacterium]
MAPDRKTSLSAGRFLKAGYFLKDTANIVKFHRKVQLNIGLIISLFVLAYVVFHIFSYFSKSSVKYYEVTEGSITQDNFYRAVALREEMIVNADQDGQCIYFTGNRSRTGVKSLICAVDSVGTLANTLTAKGSDHTLSVQDLSTATDTIVDFMSTFSENSFDDVYPFMTKLTENLSTTYGRKAAEENKDAIKTAEESGSFHSYYAVKPGLLSLSYDGMENLTEEGLTLDILRGNSYKSTSFGNDRDIKAGDPLYRLITNDDWSIAMQITEETYEAVKDSSYITVRFQADGNDATGQVKLIRINEEPVLILTFDDSMDRYADYRYMYVTLMLDEKKGLKIPNSSITKKTFFAIPKDFFTTGGDGKENGVIVRDENGTTLFVKPSIYYDDEEFCYTDDSKLKNSDVLIKNGTNQTFSVGSKNDEKEGVFNVNKGYAIFKLINILFSNEDYSIVESGTNYGIALYDHIALNAAGLKDGSIIY